MHDKLTMQDWSWEITKRCNLKCLHCLTGNYDGNEMTTHESLKAISRIVQLGGKSLRITGGEPLMRKDLSLIIKESNDLGLGLEIITNGTMLNDDFLKKSGPYIRHIAVSIDGQKQAHDHIRGTGNYVKAISGLQRVIDFGIDASAYVTLHPLNESSIDILMEELIAIGIRSFHFNEIDLKGRAIQNRHLLLKPLKTERRATNLLFQLQKNIEIARLFPDSSCTISPSSIYLQSDGKIYACTEIAFRAPEHKIAHILDQNIEEKVLCFFSKELFSQEHKCRYTSFSASGINICLNESEECPIIRRIDNGQQST